MGKRKKHAGGFLSLAKRRFMYRNKGMGLVQVMVAGAILAGLGLFMAQMANNSNKVAKGLKNTMDLSAHFAQIQNGLLRDQSCRGFLKDLRLGPVPSSRKLVVNGRTLLQQGKKLDGTSLKVKSMNVLGTGLRVVFEKDESDRSLGPKQLRRDFGLIYDWEGGRIKKCYSDVDNAIKSAVNIALEKSPKEVCQRALGGKWDEEKGCVKIELGRLDEAEEKQQQTIYITADGKLTVKNTEESGELHCAACRKSGCTAPPPPGRGWVQFSRRCKRGSLCGLNPRWRNCKTNYRRNNRKLGYLIPINGIVSSTSSTYDTSGGLSRYKCLAGVWERDKSEEGKNCSPSSYACLHKTTVYSGDSVCCKDTPISKCLYKTSPGGSGGGEPCTTPLDEDGMPGGGAAQLVPNDPC